MNKFSLIFYCLSTALVAQQNLTKNYMPLKSSGTLPDIFTLNIRNVIKDDITELKKGKVDDKSLKKTYLTETNYEIEKIVKSGNTLINDEVTAYLNKIADEVLKNNKTLRNELHIFTLKSSVVNAYSYDKGYIFLDIGLISQCESEAQLAFVLCHEISHYIKKHNINGYIRNKKINKTTYNGQSREDLLIEKCQYSKENESEADVEGFKLFEQTNYNFKQAEKAFDVLQYSHLPFELQEFKKSFFETEHFKLPSSYFLKEVSSIRNNSNEDDTKLTHPNTTKRKQTIADLIKNRSNKGKVNEVFGKENFEYIRDLARMELCRLYLIKRDYQNALYAAYILNNKYPENEYVVEIITKCMYAIALNGNGITRYTSDSYLESGLRPHTDIESYPQQLYHLIEKMPSNEWTMMSLNYVYRAHKKFPENKQMNAYGDSLFKMMANINWGIVDFVRVIKKVEPKSDSAEASAESTGSKTDMIASIQKENNFKAYDTAYYKEMYVDLFLNDKIFVGKFPGAGINNGSGGNGFSSYKKNTSTTKKTKKNSEYIKNAKNKIDKVLLLEPFYLKINETKDDDEVNYLASDQRQEIYTETVNDCAQKQNFELVTLDPSLITANDAEKINDYSIINDWFTEKFDSDDSYNNAILNTNEIEHLISKYGTQYVMKTGIVNYKNRKGKSYTYYYSFVYDIKTNDIMYKKYESFRGKASKDLINAKAYQTFYELKHLK